jgi:hypothetical protein
VDKVRTELRDSQRSAAAAEAELARQRTALARQKQVRCTLQRIEAPPG